MALNIKTEALTPYLVRMAYETQKCPGKLVKTSRGTPYIPITKTRLKTALRVSAPAVYLHP